MGVIERLGLPPLGMNDRFREAAEVQIGRIGIESRQAHLGRARIFAQEDFIPVDAEVCHDAHLARCGEKLAGQIHDDRFGFPRGDAHVLNHCPPLAGGILDLKIRQHKPALFFLRCGKEGAPIGPIDPAIQDQRRPVIARRRAEIEIETMHLRHSREIALESFGIDVIAAQQRFGDVPAGVIVRAHRRNPPLDAEQPELRKRRRFELIVGEDAGRRRVIDRDQFDPIEVGHLTQFFRDANLIAPIFKGERLARNLYVLVVIDRKIFSVARAGAQRRHSKHVRDEFKSLAIPGEDHRAGAGQSLCLLDGDGLVGFLPGFVLDQPVGPGNAHRVGFRVVPERETQRSAFVDFLVITRAGFDLHYGAGRKFHVPDADKFHFEPVPRGGGLGGSGDGVKRAVLIVAQHDELRKRGPRRIEGDHVHKPVVIEILRREGRRSGLHIFHRDSFEDSV